MRQSILDSRFDRERPHAVTEGRLVAVSPWGLASIFILPIILYETTIGHARVHSKSDATLLAQRLQARCPMTDEIIAMSRALRADFVAWTSRACLVAKQNQRCTAIQMGAELDTIVDKKSPPVRPDGLYSKFT
jgi:hypothetical protein